MNLYSIFSYSGTQCRCAFCVHRCNRMCRISWQYGRNRYLFHIAIPSGNTPEIRLIYNFTAL